jgi:hypothetical protein
LLADAQDTDIASNIQRNGYIKTDMKKLVTKYTARLPFSPVAVAASQKSPCLSDLLAVSEFVLNM